MTYLVTTKDPNYNGKTYGIKFNKGKALVDDSVVDPNLKRTADEIAVLMAKDFGYTVVKVGEVKAEA